MTVVNPKPCPFDVQKPDFLDLYTTPAYQYLLDLGMTTQTTMVSALKTILKLSYGITDPDAIYYFPWHQLTVEESSYIRQVLSEHRAFSTTVTYWAALTGVLKTALRFQLLSVQEYIDLVNSPFTPSTVIEKRPQLTETDVAKIIDWSLGMNTTRGLRDAMAVYLAFSTGASPKSLLLMRGENLHEYKIGANSLGVITVEDYSHPYKEFILAPSCYTLVQQWFAYRGDSQGPILNRLNTFPRIVAMGSQSFLEIVLRLGKAVDLPWVRPQDFRRAMIFNQMSAHDYPREGVFRGPLNHRALRALTLDLQPFLTSSIPSQ